MATHLSLTGMDFLRVVKLVVRGNIFIAKCICVYYGAYGFVVGCAHGTVVVALESRNYDVILIILDADILIVVCELGGEVFMRCEIVLGSI